ncbi:MAG: hypothetical protein C0497_02875 [Gemmatimonas sp.]|nr:hypothetical protein [Gemmatimonas sp.]
MAQAPKWFRPVGIVALLWNLLGCAAYLADVMMTPEAVAQLTAAQQAMYAARPSWAVAATAVAVWFGAAGSLGLLLRKRWATPLFITSLAALIVQDVWLFLLSGVAQVDPVAVVLQALVLLIAIGLVLLGRKAAAQGWIA